MPDQDQLDALRTQLEGVEDLKSLPHDAKDRREWERHTVACLREAFGDEAHQLQDFLDAPIGRFSPNMSPAEVQDNYNYLLSNQAQILEKILARCAAVDPKSTASIRVMGVPAQEPESTLPEHFILDPVVAANRHVPEKIRNGIVGLENLLRADAPWSDVRQQLFVVLAAEEAIAVEVLRALPEGLHLLRTDEK